MKNHWQSFLIAMQFLTIIPVRVKQPLVASNIGQSVVYYPVVGLVIATLLLVLNTLLAGQDPSVSAVLILTLWTVLTGGLHLDGLADSADAWMAGIGDRQKTLTIMKDPTCGPIAVAVLMLVLLIKFVMLSQLIEQQQWLHIAMVLLLSRTALPLLLMTTDYVRPGGIASLLVDNMPRKNLQLLFIAISVLALLSIGFVQFIIFLFAVLVLRYLMLQRLNGTTGDTAGAMLELLEVTLLTTAVLF